MIIFVFYNIFMALYGEELTKISARQLSEHVETRAAEAIAQTLPLVISAGMVAGCFGRLLYLIGVIYNC